MTDAAPTTCWGRSAVATFCWPTAAMTPTPCGTTRHARRARQRQTHAQQGQPAALQQRLYRKRNLVERFFNKLKHFRGVATRYDKRDDNYLAAIKLASARFGCD